MDWSHEFLARVGRGEVTNVEMSIDRVTARYNGVRTKDVSPAIAVPNLMKYITIAFNYLGQTADPSMLKLIVNDILEAYGWMSPLEIVKAINEGRQNPGDLYGKLSGKHVMDWIAAYDVRMQADIAKYQQNKKHYYNPEVSSILEKLMANVANPPKVKRELSQSEKEQALKERYEPISEAEQARREHMRNWTFEDGDLKEYMDAYDKNQKQ